MESLEEIKNEMMKKKTWAVVGATPSVEKFGHKIYKMLQEHQYKVYGVNPNYKELEGEVLYPDLLSLPEEPECISVVVPPNVTLSLLEEINKTGIKYVWFQPGTYDAKVLEMAKTLDLKIVYNNCVLVTLGNQ
ncbi:hypothetical protein SAMN05192551_10126 [Tindallia magadiensis]|uniref:CoA-binding domain-containing protein n=1 Tax=Tindallia magadiensis TaxID=69895 RepID=A0A1I3A6Q0_9FIRM|nr:CoA-binding protein [Tindallia magadiensis]SFH45595.1 hypothetical protein SAMN05192551_10126 [Tindallia magadiensis]